MPILCPMCNTDIEHLLHVFFDCQYAAQCWDHAGLQYDMMAVESAPEWLLNRVNEGTMQEVCKVASVLWGIWYGRNKRVWDDKLISPAIATDWSMRAVKEWQQAQKNRPDQVNSRESTVLKKSVSWRPPDAGSMKINVDASLSKESDSYAVGMVIRDDKGVFVEDKVTRLEHMEQALDAEARGVLESLRWAVEKGLQRVCVETDSLLTVQALQKNSVGVLEVGHVLEERLKYLQEHPQFSIVFVQRQANKVAHEMAKYPCSVGSFLLFTSPPDMLLETLMNDVLLQ